MSNGFDLILHKLYWEIAQDNLDDGLRKERYLLSLRESPDPWNPIDCFDEPFHEYMSAIVKSIIFSGLTVESFINYYGITRTSKTHFNRYLDKMDLLSKWIIIPKFVTGKAIDTGSQAIEFLQNLIRSRNVLVHYKTAGDGYYYDSTIGKFGSDEKLPWVEAAKEGVKAFEELIKELGKIDSTLQESEYKLNEGENDLYKLWST